MSDSFSPRSPPFRSTPQSTPSVRCCAPSRVLPFDFSRPCWVLLFACVSCVSCVCGLFLVAVGAKLGTGGSVLRESSGGEEPAGHPVRLQGTIKHEQTCEIKPAVPSCRPQIATAVSRPFKGRSVMYICGCKCHNVFCDARYHTPWTNFSKHGSVPQASRATFEVGTIDLVLCGAEWSRERKTTREESQALGTVLKTSRQVKKLHFGIVHTRYTSYVYLFGLPCAIKI